MLVEANLSAANLNDGRDMLADCACYDRYKDPEEFRKLIQERGSYMGCVAYTCEVRNQISHVSCPIFIGSFLDRAQQSL